MKRGLKVTEVGWVFCGTLGNIPCPDEKGTESWGYAGDAMIWMSNIPCPDEKGTESIPQWLVVSGQWLADLWTDEV